MTRANAKKTIRQDMSGNSDGDNSRPKASRIRDAATKVRQIEVERSGRADALQKAAERLKESGKPQRVLIVPQRDLDKAAKAMREAGVTGAIKNLSGTKHTYVGVKSGTPAFRPSGAAPKR